MELHPVIKNLFKSRGLTPQDVKEFLSWDLHGLPDLTQLLDLEKAADRIISGIEKQEQIGIYGDYDVDGTTACAVLYHFFAQLGITVQLFQPSRFIEGYGIHPSSIDKAKQHNISLLITVDCGITNNEAASYAKEQGIDLIITDHHNDTKEEIPHAFAVINPCRRDEPSDSPLRALAGVGVAFGLCLKIKQKYPSCPSIYPLLQFVAIGTLCDQVPLTPMNIKFIRHGLKQIKETSFPGIKIFFPPEERQAETIASEKITFRVGPLINSQGRMEHPEKALQLLIAKDIEEAYEAFAYLEISNKERKFVQNQVFEEAKEKVIKSIDSDKHLISIVYDPNWHEGVIGIIASKLVDNFRVPSIIFTNASEEGIIKGSARSAGELDLFECLQKHAHLFVKFGGHKAAAGLSMKKEMLPVFIKEINTTISAIPENLRVKHNRFELIISPHEISPILAKQLELLEPFGNNNPQPIFKIKNIKLDSYDILKDIHIRWAFSDPQNPSHKIRGISFNYLNKWNSVAPEQLYHAQNQEGKELSILFTLGINRFNGNEYMQINVEQIEAN